MNPDQFSLNRAVSYQIMKPALLALLGTYFLCGSRQELTAQPVPHHLEAITVAPDRTVALTVAGSVSNMFPLLPTVVSNQFRQMFDIYVLNTSSNLVDWTRLGLLVRTNNDSNPLIVHDTNAASFNQRFYGAATNHFVTGFPSPPAPFQSARAVASSPISHAATVSASAPTALS